MLERLVHMPGTELSPEVGRVAIVSSPSYPNHISILVGIPTDSPFLAVGINIGTACGRDGNHCLVCLHTTSEWVECHRDVEGDFGQHSNLEYLGYSGFGP